MAKLTLDILLKAKESLRIDDSNRYYILNKSEIEAYVESGHIELIDGKPYMNGHEVKEAKGITNG